jgi:hypothetical protein
LIGISLPLSLPILPMEREEHPLLHSKLLFLHPVKNALLIAVNHPYIYIANHHKTYWIDDLSMPNHEEPFKPDTIGMEEGRTEDIC